MRHRAVAVADEDLGRAPVIGESTPRAGDQDHADQAADSWTVYGTAKRTFAVPLGNNSSTGAWRKTAEPITASSRKIKTDAPSAQHVGRSVRHC